MFFFKTRIFQKTNERIRFFALLYCDQIVSFVFRKNLRIAKSRFEITVLSDTYLLHMYLSNLNGNSTWRYILQVNLCQNLLFLHQLTHNMTKRLFIDLPVLTWKLQTQNMLCTWIVLNVKTKTRKQCMYTTCSELVVFV